MRHYKCKSCNGIGSMNPTSKHAKCEDCQGTGEISVYTIQELREGKVAVENDERQNPDKIKLVVEKAFGKRPAIGTSKFYFMQDGDWMDSTETDLPTQSVKIFLEEIEQEEWHKTHINQTMKKEPKWGEDYFSKPLRNYLEKYGILNSAIEYARTNAVGEDRLGFGKGKESLWWAFSWSNTFEGYGFWSNHHERYLQEHRARPK